MLPVMPSKGPARRPLVAVAYEPRSVASIAAVHLAEAASGICDLMWVIDARVPEIREMSELLRRFGVVVDIGGDGVDAAAKQIGAFRPDGIVTYFDASMVKVASIAERLGLPFVTPAAARLLVDKLYQRRALQEAGVQVPRFWSVGPVSSADPLAAVGSDVVWPAVLKPRSDAGSHDTFLACDEADVRALLDGLGADRPDMMLEEYLSDDPAWTQSSFADYVSVESVVSHGVVSHVAVTGRFPPAETFRETGFFVPAWLDADSEQAVLDLASAAARALDVGFGCLHTEVKFTAEGPRILEVNGRIGFGIPAMLDQAAGFSMFAASMQIALGEQVFFDRPIACERLGYRLFLQPPAIVGTVRAIDGVNVLADRPGVESVTIHRGPGTRIDWREGTRTFVLAVVGVAADHAQVRETWRVLTEEVSVLYDESEVGAGHSVRTACKTPPRPHTFYAG